MQEETISRIRKIKDNLKVVIITLLALIIVFKFLILFSEEKNLFQPDKGVDLTPKSIGIEYDDVYFNTKDGQLLNGWFVPAKEAKITIIFCSGRGGNLSDRLQKVKFFYDIGLNALFFDYRGYGISSGKPSEAGLYKDAQAAYDYLLTRTDIDKTKVVAYGKSLGGPVASDLCLHRKLAALILEGPLPSLKTYVGEMGGFLPTEWLVSEKFDTISRVKKIKIPKLFVQGMDDEVISFSEGRLVFNAAINPKEFVPFDGHHDENLFTVSDTFRDRLFEFFSEHHIL